MSVQAFKAAMPTQHHNDFDAAMAPVAAPHQGSVLSILQALIARFKAAGLPIPWLKLFALIPLIGAALTTGDWTAVIDAILALFTPSSAAPAPATP